MGIMYPEPKPPIKMKIAKNIIEAVGTPLQDGEIVYVLEKNTMYMSNGRHQLFPIGEEKECEQIRKYIKCQYCESELEDKYINCPNCGAPLKRR